MVKFIMTKIRGSELLKGSITAFIFKILGFASQYFFIFLLAGIYGAEAVGIFSLVFVVLQFLGILSRLGTDSAILKFTAEYSKTGRYNILSKFFKASYIVTFVLALVFSILVYFFADVIATGIFNKPHFLPYVRSISFAIIPFSLLSINYEFLRGLKKIALYVALQGGSPFLLAAVALFVFSRFSQSLIIISYSITFAFFFVFCLSVFFVWRENVLLRNLSVDKKIIKKLLSLALPLMVVGAVSYTMGWIDTVILGIYGTDTELGIYNVCLKLATVTSIPLVAVNSIAAPKFAEYWGQKNIEGIKSTTRSSTRLIVATSLPLLIFILIFPTFTLSLFGSEFAEGRIALIIISIAQFVNALSGSVGLLLQMTSYQKHFQRIIVAALIINVVLSLVLVPLVGINGAAIATSTCLIFWNAAALALVRQKFGFWIFKI